MKRLLILINFILVGGLLCACVAPPPSQPTADEIAEDIMVRINAEREALGLEPLIVNEQLMMMAKWRSQDMADGDYYSHTPPEGHPTLADFCKQLGYDSLHAPYENLVYIGRTEDQPLDGVAASAVESWKGSPGHWRLIASPHNEMTGVGVVVENDRVIVTQLFWDGGVTTPGTARQYNRET